MTEMRSKCCKAIVVGHFEITPSEDLKPGFLTRGFKKYTCGKCGKPCEVEPHEQEEK